ncbi:HlyD family secretion protein [Parabacteroides sp. PF5-5]|uniref:efflux RND transporter periplasmic adaptor subunit n=1 Tax=unclassified Parabacteroides TaxID=2649774 RepID=UPI00247695E4|nr:MULTISPECIES: efflux RND transporter periplasmic adaptor subunit [unclassified Parabacteroides]MDH6304867.1 HlyD family secretion protein [Parabacteroides sp. PH5-39]MDH6316047.1 HlyD family secretion protein [Parabacteroides sp. PF5-13]MDH6319704.1 HlyD family secretion protein [Parabacteroides sp. PH5-13]MDH6323435.1 HlyD family secretion protein [Parabacteroides sp. PH5-8]MDH6327057.1 HlyD family secretion protein [Parabacteroides sp. PH5-41]
MKKNKKLIISITAVVLLVGCYFLFSSKTPKSTLRLEMTKASRSSISNSVTATGTVEPVVKVDVGTQVSGIIDKIYVDYNSVVTKGQLIAEMDKVNLQAELASQEASLASNKTEYEYQQRNYARSKALYEKQLISDSEYETATYTYEKAKSAYEQSRSNMTKVRRNLEYAIITSPIDGVVINRAVEEGQTVAAGFSTPTLFTIANDLTQMRVIADVDEADIGQVEEGQNVKFTVDAYPNDVFEGTVTQVRLEATTTSNVVTYEVVISAYNPDLKLKPGLTANVTIYTLERNNVLTIPSKALRFIPDEEMLGSMNLTVENAMQEAPAGKKIVWQKAGNALQPKIVTLGTSNLNVIEVTDGLSDGEEIVLELTSAAPAVTNGSAERSPFMPGPPNNNRKKQ